MLISASIGICAAYTGCENAKDFLEVNFDRVHDFDGQKTNQDLECYFSELKRTVANSKDVPVVIGGDHSCAIGTWSGVAEKHGDFGLIWVDAHMDSHTPQTSITQNVHGMPLANLLGYGDFTHLANPKLKPENLIPIGIRSYEPEEKELLDKLGVKIYYDENCKNIHKVIEEAINHFPAKLPLGVSIDMDAFTHKDAPGVGTPEPGGIDLKIFTAAMQAQSHRKLCCLEVVEFNPTFDKDNITANNVINIINHLEANITV